MHLLELDKNALAVVSHKNTFAVFVLQYAQVSVVNIYHGCILVEIYEEKI